VIKIKTTKKFGRGLYATKRIRKGTVVEVSPVIILSDKDRKLASKTILATYLFDWGSIASDNRMASVVLGLGSLFNHNDIPNLIYKYNLKQKTVSYIASKDIGAGDQLFIDYDYKEELDGLILKYIRSQK
jgi:SET domain-containing protein